MSGWIKYVFDIVSKLADKKNLPLLILYGLVVFYMPQLSSQSPKYGLGLLLGTFVATLIYLPLFVFGKGKRKDEAKTIAILKEFFNNEVHNLKEETLKIVHTHKDKGECVRIFMVAMMDGIEIVVNKFIQDLDFENIENRMIAVKDYIQFYCQIRNVPSCVYAKIHALNFQKIYHFYIVTIFVNSLIAKDNLTTTERLGVSLTTIFDLYQTIIKNTLEDINNLNGQFTKELQQNTDSGKNIIYVSQNNANDIYFGLSDVEKKMVETIRNNFK